MRDVFLILILLVSVSGCLNESSLQPMSEKVPKDLDIVYGYGGTHAEWGRTEVRIDANGRGLYQSGSGSMRFDDEQRFEHEEFRKTFVLNEMELLALLVDLEKSGFYSLNDSYVNNEIMDGYSEFISITKNNVTKSVLILNTEAPPSYQKAAEIIEEKAENKTR